MTINDEVSLHTNGFHNFSGSTGKTLGIRDLVIKSFFVPPLVETPRILFSVVVSYRLYQTPRISVKLKAPKVSTQGMPPSSGLEGGPGIKFPYS